MINFHRETKKYLRDSLKSYGFRSAEFGEGFFCPLKKGVIAFFSADGIWSELRISCGLRFDSVNNFLIKSSRLAEWPDPAVDGFKLKLYGLFIEDMGCYYSDNDSLDAAVKTSYRKGAVVATAEEIKDHILSNLDRLANFSDLSAAVPYVKERQYFEPFSEYTIPAAARILNDKELWDWAVDYFSPIVAENNRTKLPQNRRDYDKLLQIMACVHKFA
ncbi:MULTISPECIES: hypothetical protein [unclassified Azospirillum]|uniref:hypothetical protein n=1 Tax=unclassified Azospirillum TaxID=2630922 RepID=UPI000B648008|nr:MULTISPECIES: hypothetical protein [unclassified Azospirillum]SNS88750.1 hypothetical protein SAMN05880556_11485 [Azospirillum sp. RU38E]SNT05893.1 hypothetical protein SAMN05880591_11485 [Azospirillum sp. RU37A]